MPEVINQDYVAQDPRTEFLNLDTYYNAIGESLKAPFRAISRTFTKLPQVEGSQ